MTHDRHTYSIHLRYIPTRLAEELRCSGCSRKRKRAVLRCACSYGWTEEPGEFVNVSAIRLTPYKADPDCGTCNGTGFVPAAVHLCPCARLKWAARCPNCKPGCSPMHVCLVETPAEAERADDLAAVVVRTAKPSPEARRRAESLQ